MDVLKYPAWQASYVAAVRENDPQNLTRLVHEAEGAIFDRMLALSSSPNGHEEQHAIKDACEGLFAIKIEKLKWPRPF
jgi:hypothetical protein